MNLLIHKFPTEKNKQNCRIFTKKIFVVSLNYSLVNVLWHNTGFVAVDSFYIYYITGVLHRVSKNGYFKI